MRVSSRSHLSRSASSRGWVSLVTTAPVLAGAAADADAGFSSGLGSCRGPCVLRPHATGPSRALLTQVDMPRKGRRDCRVADRKKNHINKRVEALQQSIRKSKKAASAGQPTQPTTASATSEEAPAAAAASSSLTPTAAAFLSQLREDVAADLAASAKPSDSSAT